MTAEEWCDREDAQKEILQLQARIAELERERDEALRVRDLAREASNRDLEAKRTAEAANAALCEEMARLTLRYQESSKEAERARVVINRLSGHSLYCEFNGEMPASISEETLSRWSRIGSYYIGRRAAWEEVQDLMDKSL